MIEKALLQKYRYFSKLINGARRGISRSGPGKYSQSYVCGPGHTPLIGSTIGDLIDQGAEKWGNDREAVVSVHQNIRKGFLDIKEDADKFATGLLALGVRPGDRVGIWGPNTYEWYLTQMAAAKLGAILVNINPAYQPAELLYCLNKVGVKVVVASQVFKTQDYYQILTQIMPELVETSSDLIESKSVPTLKRIILMSEDPRPGTIPFTTALYAGAGLQTEVDEIKTRIKMDDGANIQFTSGTTGNPKGACLSHHNIVNNAYNIGLRIGYDKKYARICCCCPLYHTFGCVIGNLNALIHGCTMVLPSLSFDPQASIQAIVDEKCTSVYGTPTMFIDLLDVARQSKPDLSSVHTGIMAGATCPEELCRDVVNELNMKDFVVAYGMTETSPVTFQGFCDDDMELKTSTIGYPADHTEVKVVDEEGQVVPTGVAGELCTRGYSTMLGYWGDKEKTEEVYKEDGWFHTGDTAVIFENGYGQIVGRMKDMIIRGGENIYPREIEEFLHSHPDIAEVQVIGVSDRRLGEELAVWVRMRGDAAKELTIQDIKQFCKGRLAHFKIPKYVYFVESFPTTVTGKIQKFKMREVTERWIKENK